jgi:N utilization substance protein B
VYALQALYHVDLTKSVERDALNALWQTVMEQEGMDEVRPPESGEVEFALRLVQGVAEKRTAIDAMIDACSTNWRLKRMPLVDRNILRVATYELMDCNDIPGTVSVNEAIELAKLFGGDDSRAFVNGMVDRIGRQLGRLDEKRRGRGKRR